jgi:hypothetical protein
MSHVDSTNKPTSGSPSSALAFDMRLSSMGLPNTPISPAEKREASASATVGLVFLF